MLRKHELYAAILNLDALMLTVPTSIQNYPEQYHLEISNPFFRLQKVSNLDELNYFSIWTIWLL